MVSFAKAIVLGRRFVSLSTLRHGHGVKDISTQNARLTELKARIESGGTFYEFNKEVSSLNRVRYIGTKSQPESIALPAASSDSLVGIVISLQDILARIPFLCQDYYATFAKEPYCAALGHLSYEEQRGYFTVSVVDRKRFPDRASLMQMVQEWRTRFPFLTRWRFIEARLDWGNPTLTFANLPQPVAGEMSEQVLVGDDERGHFFASDLYLFDARGIALPIEEMLIGTGGGFTASGGLWAIAPLQGHYLSEFSLQYLGLFLLSSLVRYRPDAWIHAVTRTSRQDRPADDQCLALIERFLQVDQAATPELLVRFFNVHEDR